MQDSPRAAGIHPQKQNADVQDAELDKHRETTKLGSYHPCQCQKKRNLFRLQGLLCVRNLLEMYLNLNDLSKKRSEKNRKKNEKSHS